MSDLTEFLLARIAADEEVASHGDGGILDIEGAWFNREAILAECAAKRRIVEVAETCEDEEVHVDSWVATQMAIRHLAAVYADHPDYREEWRP